MDENEIQQYNNPENIAKGFGLVITAIASLKKKLDDGISSINPLIDKKIQSLPPATTDIESGDGTRKIKSFVKGDDVATAIGTIISMLNKHKQDTDSGLGSLARAIDEKISQIDLSTGPETARKQAVKEASDSLRKEFAQQLDDLSEYFEEKLEALKPNPADAYEYMLSDDDKNGIIKILTKEFPKERLQSIEKLIEELQGSVERNRSLPVSGMGDFGGPFEQGSNITVRKDQSGAYVISSTATGGGTTAYETPVGTIDGANTSFTVSHTPIAIILNAYTYFEGDGYTFDAGTMTVTMLVIPVAGSTLRSQYNA